MELEIPYKTMEQSKTNTCLRDNERQLTQPSITDSIGLEFSLQAFITSLFFTQNSALGLID